MWGDCAFENIWLTVWFTLFCQKSTRKQLKLYGRCLTYYFSFRWPGYLLAKLRSRLRPVEVISCAMYVFLSKHEAPLLCVSVHLRAHYLLLREVTDVKYGTLNVFEIFTQINCGFWEQFDTHWYRAGFHYASECLISVLYLYVFV